MAVAFPWVKRSVLRPSNRELSHCVRFSPDDRLLASTQFDGSISFFDTASMAFKFDINVGQRDGRRQPVTSLSFRPGAKPSVLATTSSGQVLRYDLRNGECFSKVQEEGNETYCSDYRGDAAFFATAGHDAIVRLYDEAEGALVRTFSTAAVEASTTPAQRLYSVKFCSVHPQLVITAGWSGLISIFDIRQRDDGAVLTKPQVLNGAYITGDALAVAGTKLLSAAHRLESPRLTIWDLDTHAAEELAWPTSTEFLPECAAMTSDGEFLAVAGSDGQQVKAAAFVLERRSMKPVVDAKFEHSITSCHFAHNEPMVAFSDGEGAIHIYENRLSRKAGSHAAPAVAAAAAAAAAA